MKRKILILGSGGMLGHIVYLYLKSLNKYEIHNTIYRTSIVEGVFLDVTDDLALEKLINNVKPDYIINCIGALIGLSNINRSLAVYLNSYLPHRIVNLLKNSNSKIIHISTDCVFSGSVGGYYENDFKDAKDFYGMSKSLGEINDEKNITLRTSIIGPELKTEGEGLFHWFMNQGEKVNGYSRSIWGGVTTLQLAKVIDHFLEKDNYNGLFNVTNSQEISKYELLCKINEIWGKKSEINLIEGKDSNKSLRTNRTDLNFKIPTYDIMLENMHEWMINNKSLYSKVYRF